MLCRIIFQKILQNRCLPGGTPNPRAGKRGRRAGDVQDGVAGLRKAGLRAQPSNIPFAVVYL